jgi:hypothetical protein
MGYAVTKAGAVTHRHQRVDHGLLLRMSLESQIAAVGGFESRAAHQFSENWVGSLFPESVGGIMSGRIRAEARNRVCRLLAGRQYSVLGFLRHLPDSFRPS